MIPLSAGEARDLLKVRLAEAERCRRQIEHFGRLQANERARLERLIAEASSVAATWSLPAPSDALSKDAQSKGRADR